MRVLLFLAFIALLASTVSGQYYTLVSVEEEDAREQQMDPMEDRMMLMPQQMPTSAETMYMMTDADTDFEAQQLIGGSGLGIAPIYGGAAAVPGGYLGLGLAATGFAPAKKGGFGGFGPGIGGFGGFGGGFGGKGGGFGPGFGGYGGFGGGFGGLGGFGAKAGGAITPGVPAVPIVIPGGGGFGGFGGKGGPGFGGFGPGGKGGPGFGGFGPGGPKGGFGGGFGGTQGFLVPVPVQRPVPIPIQPAPSVIPSGGKKNGGGGGGDVVPAGYKGY